MTIIDYIIIIVYFIGLLVLGGTLGKKIKSSKDMFIAGRNSSWWLSGLSTYMTIFSASTFVVWGGVAFRSGIVAIVVGLTLGIASMVVGGLVAGKWSRLKINSPAEYISIRFGQPATRFYTIVGIIGRGVHVAVALYAIAIMAVALIPLPEGHFLVNPETGHLSVTYAILLLGAITFVYTALGGYLAVLMTDLVQFAVLIAMVLIMIPLSFKSVGGMDAFIANAPEGYFSLFSNEYSFVWMVLWLFLNIFMIGGDWPFVQRYISVPTEKDAKKSVWLVGVLYLITPLIWYIPCLVYRTIRPDANPEQSYMLMSQHVLGPGMLGLMLAAMISATLSTISGTLNVYANVFTFDIYKAYRPAASEKRLMNVGRSFTYIYGILITLIAVMIPVLGGAERVVVSILTLVISPLFIPSLWGLFSKRIGQKSIWLSMGITYTIALIIKFGFNTNGLFTHSEWGNAIYTYIQERVQFVDAFVGLITPVALLTLIELFLWKKEQDAGWNRVSHLFQKNKILTVKELEKAKISGSMYSSLAFKILFGTYAAIGITMVLIAFGSTERKGQTFCFAILFLGVSSIAFLIRYWIRKRKNQKK
ncbi:MAG: sodium:solute symporter [Dysgonamonadaceae bacterium]|jgi:SSS family transporter|nr:sodium:solute symporter [Dysgonamonadaceae bacterium]